MPTQLGEHIVSSYEEELTNLAQSISEMGGVVEVAVGNAVRALLKLDHNLARANIANDKRIDEMQRRIDETAVSMIARRQPMARDLRAIITAIHVANDLERVGDMAKTISRRALQIEGLSLAPKFYNGVKHMSDLILRQQVRARRLFQPQPAGGHRGLQFRRRDRCALYLAVPRA